MKGLHHYRRHVIVAIFAFTAFFAPPDPLSQIVMSVPMWVLYEAGVLTAWLLVLRKRKAEQSASEAAG